MLSAMTIIEIAYREFNDSFHTIMTISILIVVVIVLAIHEIFASHYQNRITFTLVLLNTW